MFIKLLVNGFAVMVTAYLLPGVKVTGYFDALVVAIVLGVLNTFVRPILKFLTFPITLVTLGLFSFVINACVILLADWLIKGFDVGGFWRAMAFSIVLSVVSWFLNKLKGRGDEYVYEEEEADDEEW